MTRQGERSLDKDLKKIPQIFSYRPPTRDIFIRQSQSPQRVQLILACGETNLCQSAIAHLRIKPCKSEFRLKGKKAVQNHFPWHSTTLSVKSSVLQNYYHQTLRGRANTLELHRQGVQVSRTWNIYILWEFLSHVFNKNL